ncbi:paired immunoglobulin-like type 2 receptor beta [Leucoraja erinacea]|uniref:paired immunoglobulin-like type 2 receptor beta n=1 Tax=Leucoraja erinaceus TaxID=7782 RepID=UPI0024580AD8|nr:paired immunoglobulin-like type 2 receptor beta [Leucoraja erinacea]
MRKQESRRGDSVVWQGTTSRAVGSCGGQRHRGVAMAFTLHLLLLHLAVALTDGGKDHRVDQPRRVYGVEGGSVTLPCNFSYPAHLRPRGFDVAWRYGNFHGPFIFNLTQAFTDSLYKGRITLLGFPIRDHTASIRLDNLRRRDSGRYYCRVGILGIDAWQSLTGTLLSFGVKPSVPVTVKSTTSTVRANFPVTVGSTTPGEPTPWRPFVAGGCGLVLLLLLIAGVVICIRQRERRRKGPSRRDDGTPTSDRVNNLSGPALRIGHLPPETAAPAGRRAEIHAGGPRREAPGLRDVEVSAARAGSSPDLSSAMSKQQTQHSRAPDAAGVRDKHSPSMPASKGNVSEEIVYSTVRVKDGSGPRNVSQPEPDLLYAAVRFSPNQS